MIDDSNLPTPNLEFFHDHDSTSDKSISTVQEIEEKNVLESDTQMKA